MAGIRGVFHKLGRQTIKMNQLEKTLRELIEDQYFAVLSTLSNGLPYTNLVSFAVTKDLRSLIFVTDRNSRKFRNIRENGNVSLLIDNRTNRPSDISQAIAVTGIGIAREAEDKGNNLRAVFLARHPHLRQFVDASNNALIVVTIREYIIAHFDKTQRLAIF